MGVQIQVTVENVADAWRPLTPPQRTRATYLIGRATRLLNRTWADLDARISAGTLTASELEDAVKDMVIACLAGPDIHGARSHSRTSGPYTEAVTFAGDGSTAWITVPSWLTEQLGHPTAAKPRSGTVWLA